MLVALPFFAVFVLRTRDVDAFSRIEIPLNHAFVIAVGEPKEDALLRVPPDLQ